MTRGTPGRRRQHRPRRAARRHRRSRRPGSRRRSRSRSASARRCSTGRATRSGSWRASRRRSSPMPTFAGDEIDPARSDGDLVVQACADDPPVVLPRHPQPHPHRARRRRAAVVAVGLRPHVEHRRRADHAPQPDGLQGRHQQPRRRGRRRARSEHVWVRPLRRPGVDARRQLPGDAPHPHAARGVGPLHARRPGGRPSVGSRATARRSRAPRSTTSSTSRAQADGEPVIPADAHIRLAAPAENDGVRLLRRGYSFTDGIDPVTNQLDAGLFFIAYQRDPRTGFIPVQEQPAHRRAQRVHPPHQQRDASRARRASVRAATSARPSSPDEPQRSMRRILSRDR